MTKTVGNVYTIEYANDPQSGAYYPAKIAYTGNASTDCRRSVTFVREARSDIEPRFEAGFAVHPTQRICAIVTAVDDTMVTTYTLDYEQGGATGRSRLTAITRSDAAGDHSRRRRSRTRTSNVPDSHCPSPPSPSAVAWSAHSTWAAAGTVAYS